MSSQDNCTDLHGSTVPSDCRCGWELRPQAFRWSPMLDELGVSLATLPASGPFWTAGRKNDVGRRHLQRRRLE
ncbi:MAG: hypothetical protein DLM62_03540 [Pseudonocardiales bacterium]|nr:MAG: hypothetical protein DLM62_03540 [Pseudonocardiales bacterium]